MRDDQLSYEQMLRLLPGLAPALLLAATVTLSTIHGTDRIAYFIHLAVVGISRTFYVVISIVALLLHVDVCCKSRPSASQYRQHVLVRHSGYGSPLSTPFSGPASTSTATANY